MPFVHLHNHSHYSLLDGLLKFDEIIARSKEDGVGHAAITDHGAMYGVIEFYQKCKEEDINPIIGVETYLAPKSRHDKNIKLDALNYHLVLIAKNNHGYKNLIKLISLAHIEGYYYKPRIDWELLERYHHGIIATSACLGGEIAQLILADDVKKAKKRALDYNSLFGQDHFYLEIMDHPNLEGQAKVNRVMIEMSRELNIPLLATNDAHYNKSEDDEAQDILLCIQNKKKLSDSNRMKMKGLGDFSLKPAKEMITAFADTPQAIENSLKLASMCNLEIPLGETKLPNFKVPTNYDGNTYLKHLCYLGLSKRYGIEYVNNQFKILDKKKLGSLTIELITERLDYELSVIAKMGWPAYFLIVADFVNWAKDNKIVVGPGRGSAAGSIVCYLTGITNLDPLKYELLFERFLNPERVSMPDIDLDFADIRRDEVINYVEDKYGKDHVAQIITFGTMAAKAAVRDVGRVLDMPYSYCDRLSKMIPMFSSLKKAINEVAELKEVYNNEEDAKKIIDYAIRLEGVARHTSTHACGILITPEPLTEYVPIQFASASDNSIVSQYSLHAVEDLGLLKMDFLGLKNLSIIESAIKIVKNTKGIEIDIEQIPLNDKLTFQLFKKANTTGIFQFESSGMKRYLKDLKPSEFEDIIAMVALYRPGPMEWIADYIAGKHKKKKIEYLHPKLESILNKTYGVAIYQEQVMQIARDLAGFSMGQADILRKAMGKKIPKLLAEQKEKFVEGCVKNSIHQKLAEKIFSFIEPFAGYGFNRSHAACYALIGYQTAYLKAHFPVEFMAALLSADQNDTDRIAVEIDELKKIGLNILPPDINESYASFTVITSGTKDNKVVDSKEKLETIRFGLLAIKNLGEHIVETIILERKQNGPYKNLFDFLSRLTDKDLNKKSLESLIKCGALDSFENRSLMLANLEKLLKYNKDAFNYQYSQQKSLFNNSSNYNFLAPPELENNNLEISDLEKITWEKELLGLFVSQHPLLMFEKNLKSLNKKISQLSISSSKENSIIIAGVISSIKKILTKKNESMLFAKIEDETGSIELLVFPKQLQKNPELWQENNLIICSGKISPKDDELKLLVNQANILDPDDIDNSIEQFKKDLLNYRENNSKTIVKNDISIDKNALRLVLSDQISDEEKLALKEFLDKNVGENRVEMKVLVDDKYTVLRTNIFVDNTEKMRTSLVDKFKNSVKVIT